MPKLRPFVPHCLRLWCEVCALYHYRPLHTLRKGASIFRRVKISQPEPSQNPSLLEELFPEEVRKKGDQGSDSYDYAQKVPRLPLPEVDDTLGRFEHESDRERSQPQSVTKAAAANAFRQQQLAVLSLETSSKSLVESDFRRIAPKGQHIDDWTGPGDILKSELKRKRDTSSRCLRANLNNSHTCARSHHVGTCRSLLHTVPESRVRSNLSGPCHPSSPNCQNVYANIC